MNKRAINNLKKGDYIIKLDNNQYPQFENMILKIKNVVNKFLIIVESNNGLIIAVNAQCFRKATLHEIDYLEHYAY